jgi:hypothetical protein
MTESEAYQKNTKEQYEAIGRFVEAFEGMVHEARTCCINLLTRGLSDKQSDLISIPFYHYSFSAKGIFETFRAVLVEILSDKEYADQHLGEGDINCFRGVLAAISGEYDKLQSKRNNLLHATLFVGYMGSGDLDASTFYARKFAATGDGLSLIELPNTAQALDELRIRCDEVKTWISTIHACLPTGPNNLRVRDCFGLDKTTKVWQRLWPSPHRFSSA